MTAADDKKRSSTPPAQYWRRWHEDAPPAAAVAEDTPAQLAELPGFLAAKGLDDAPDSPYRVLIVEDDPSQALFAESVLHGAGMQTRTASVTNEVMQAMTDYRPDLVLMDLHMPGMDGVELTGLIRGRREFLSTPIVFLTGDDDPERQFEVLDVGADDFLVKPVRPRHLISAIHSRVSRARQLQAPVASDRHPLTGLYTRPQILERLSSEIAGERAGAVLLLEIEGIAALRDRLGYTTLESVLTDAGRRLGELVGDIPAARLNDNTFLVYAQAIADDKLDAWAHSLRDRLGRHAFTAGNQALRLRAVVGYAALGHGFADAGQALLAAEQALREARNTPSGVAMWRDQVAGADSDGGHALVDTLRRAVDTETGLELLYQPIVAVSGGDEAQYQTLVRLRDDDNQLHTAAEILPLADAAGLLHEVDRRVLELALDTLRQRKGNGPALRLFVTQSARSLAQEGYAERMCEALSSHAIDGTALVIDVRQEDAMIHTLSLLDFCNAVAATGVQMCLSQYAPGEDSDALLAQLPLNYVRLDARFSRMDETHGRDGIRIAIEHAHRLGLLVVGQQVEDPQAAATLWMSGVDFIQGNLVQQADDALNFDFHHSVL